MGKMKLAMLTAVVVSAMLVAVLLSGCKAPDLMPPSEDGVEPQPTDASAETGAEDNANVNLDEVFEEEDITPPQIPG